VKQPPTTHIKLKTRLLPVLIGVLLLMQLTFPYKGWTILLVGLGSLWLVSYLWARALAQSLNLSREMRFGWAHVGDHLEERFTLTNAGPVPSLWAEIVDHSTLPGYSANRVTGVDRNGRNRWYTQGVCRRRGIFTLGPTTIRTGDPFGLYTISVHVSTTGVRNYISGDSLKSIHWPTTARQGSLYVRLFDSTPSGDWWIFLDLDDQIQAGQDDTSTEEHAIILAASLADRGLRLGRAVGLAAHGQELTWLPPQAADFQRQNILRALALANPGSCSLGQLLTQTRPALGHFSSLIIITVATEIHNWIEALPPLLQRGAIATVLLLDPASFGGTGEAAGAGALLTNLGVTSFVITRDVLDQPEARPGLKGHWQWRVSPSGRAVAINRPEDMAWKSLR
jgi:uncharacterized protein (DUF58 family)